jgi:hypothetical protein
VQSERCGAAPENGFAVFARREAPLPRCRAAEPPRSPSLMRTVPASDKRRSAAHFRNFDVRAVKRSVREIPKIEDNEKDGALPRLFLPK